MSVPPKKKTTPRERVAQLVRLLGSTERGERANAWRMLDPAMKGADLNWSEIGNLIERGYTEAEILVFAQAARAEGVEAGIKIGMARASNGSGNTHLTLPKPVEMACYCHERLGRLKDDAQREFIDEMYASTQRGISPPRGSLGYLASLYIKLGGKV